MQLVKVLARTGSVKVEKLVAGSGGANNSPLTSVGDVRNDAGSEPSSA